jgi:DNA repair ATPase RecN
MTMTPLGSTMPDEVRPIADQLRQKLVQVRQQMAELDETTQKLASALAALEGVDMAFATPAGEVYAVEAKRHRKGSVTSTVLQILEHEPEAWVPLGELQKKLSDAGHDVAMTSLSPILTKLKAVRRLHGKAALVDRVGGD